MSSKSFKQFDYVDFADEVSPKKSNTLRISTYNVHDFTDRARKNTFDMIIKNIKLINPDILILEEVYLFRKNSANITKLIDHMKKIGLIYHSFGSTEINAVFSRYEFKSDEIDLGKDTIKRVNRYAQICNFEELQLVVVGTHLDVFDETGTIRKNQIIKILNRIKIETKDNNESVIIAGDFNSLRRDDYADTEWKYLTDNDKLRKVKTIEDVVPIIEKNGYVDSFAMCDKTIVNSVWSGRRVDYIYGYDVIFSDSNIFRNTASDHYPIYADIELNQ